MALCSAAVTSNANSKLLRIKHVSDNVALSAPQRMAIIARIVDEYHKGTADSVKRIRAEKAVEFPRRRLDT
ncbi:hypothetical protein BPBIEBS31_93 [Mycobacterium phage BPBiebs31]|uniref:Uncharacterized protein n=1 Tax=Mycobacterium phage BPBiebs31 TaxID=2902900 RepID=G1DA46_9CAUD|nr:hypothetical protein FGG18_gp09 [Mycobacterium phage BPBiebs31]AEJ91942.1 hypothetical protein BPBIEBS31_93 [Mycobacterium phage BPBiebs31]